jgi:hypothetical protein
MLGTLAFGGCPAGMFQHFRLDVFSARIGRGKHWAPRFNDMRAPLRRWGGKGGPICRTFS